MHVRELIFSETLYGTNGCFQHWPSKICAVQCYLVTLRVSCCIYRGKGEGES